MRVNLRETGAGETAAKLLLLTGEGEQILLQVHPPYSLST